MILIYATIINLYQPRRTWKANGKANVMFLKYFLYPQKK